MQRIEANGCIYIFVYILMQLFSKYLFICTLFVENGQHKRCTLLIFKDVCIRTIFNLQRCVHPQMSSHHLYLCLDVWNV